ncbi:DUF411 domain-containing protein [Motiliproteus sp. SC1-56]|uniref:DUF411 domain-containing protein n=1 Tax=Motiliproteus sp. SC1-56 TaxID=2799565 RepID=UPI001F5DFE48|nr:DUF411 domain-containing protein [Motiliproteus sp. SC1-56]
MKKALLATTLGVIMAVGAASAGAADPVWLEGRTDRQYDITVYRAESCGCCKGWIEHLEAHNFRVEDVVVEDVDPYKEKHGVPPQGASCHTAVVDGKVIEGHVPAQDIKALLASESDIRLLTVPGMPSGGPGMDWEGARKDAFKVYALSEDGEVSLFKEYSDY